MKVWQVKWIGQIQILFGNLVEPVCVLKQQNLACKFSFVSSFEVQVVVLSFRACLFAQSTQEWSIELVGDKR